MTALLPTALLTLALQSFPFGAPSALPPSPGTTLSSVASTPSNSSDPIARWLFQPELVMQHRRSLSLSDDQSKQLKSLVTQAQVASLDAQWDMAEASQDLSDLLKLDRPNVDAVRRQAAKVMTIETDLKLTQIALLVEIKGLLTAKQQERLRDLRKDGRYSLYRTPRASGQRPSAPRSGGSR
jgi:Spy/CpxP family protein refolding chaperone